MYADNQQIKSNFGLIPRRYDTDCELAKQGQGQNNATQWERFAYHLHRLNEDCRARTPGVSYRLLFLGRHGEGVHNVAEAKYGTEAWNVSILPPLGLTLHRICIASLSMRERQLTVANTCASEVPLVPPRWRRQHNLGRHQPDRNRHSASAEGERCVEDADCAGDSVSAVVLCFAVEEVFGYGGDHVRGVGYAAC